MSQHNHQPVRTMKQPTSASSAVPQQKALTRIRNAWIAGLISTVVTSFFVALAVSGTSLAGFTAWEAIDVGVTAALTFGIFRKSRICAVLMLIYFTACKVIFLVNTESTSGLAITLAFIWIYVNGVLGTFAYHKHVKQVTGFATPT